MAATRPRLAFYQRRRFLLLCVCGLTVYHHRQRLHQLFQRAYATTTGALTAAETATSTLSQASNDLHTYLHTSTPTSQPVPRSLRRLLRMLASPEGLVMLRSAAAGAAGVALKELSGGKGKGKSVANKGWLEEIVKVGLSSGGSRLISLVITEAVREVTNTVMEFQSRMRKADDKHPLEIIMDGLLSERGERLIVQTAREVTRVAIPLAMQGARNDQNKTIGCNGALNGYASGVVTGSGRKRPSSARYPSSSLIRVSGKPGNSFASAGSVPSSPSTPRSRKMLATALAMSGQKSWMEKLILLASRDPAFIHGVLRAVASEAIRTYLTTQAELKLGRMKKVVKADPISGKCICSVSGEAERGEEGTEANYIVLSKSLWKVLVKSVVVDVRDAFTSLMKNPPEPRWIFL